GIGAVDALLSRSLPRSPHVGSVGKRARHRAHWEHLAAM
ncbi:MAG: hypothetical protein AVDCRST_MAG62-1628, partial [uncultured Sphingomonas sp.]